MRYYNRTLSQDLWGINKLGFRQIVSLVQWLPVDAALWRSNKTAWGNTEELLATLIEVNDAQLRAFIQANSKPNSKKLEPIKIERPYENNAKSAKKHTTLKEMINLGGIPVKNIKGGE